MTSGCGIRRRALAAIVALAAGACTNAAAAPAVPPAPPPLAAPAGVPESVRIVERLRTASDAGMPSLDGASVSQADDLLAASGVHLHVIAFKAGSRQISAQWPEPGSPLPADGLAVVWTGIPPAPSANATTATASSPPSGDAGNPPVPAAQEATSPVQAATPDSAPTSVPQVSTTPLAPPPPPAPPEPSAPAVETSAEPDPRRGGPSADERGSALAGAASWYGPGFEGRTTACGGRFDSGELTLASRELPCGTRVRITGPSGRSVDATVTDYGPARWTERRFDLSRATFAALAPLGAGVLDVRVEVR